MDSADTPGIRACTVEEYQRSRDGDPSLHCLSRGQSVGLTVSSASKRVWCSTFAENLSSGCHHLGIRFICSCIICVWNHYNRELSFFFNFGGRISYLLYVKRNIIRQVRRRRIWRIFVDPVDVIMVRNLSTYDAMLH